MLSSPLKTGKNFFAINTYVSRYIIEASLNAYNNRKDDISRRKRALEITAKNSGALLESLGIKIEMKMARPDLFERNYFMVCNHMSYMDILILSSCQPAMFVTSVEMEKTFFLGDMAKLGGSFFVDRINRRKMKDEVEALKKLVLAGLNVFIFPEGTSSNGLEGVHPFKKSLFRVPFQAEIPILPVCIKYETINNQPFSKANCDRICWYGDMTFAPHILQLMGVHQMQVSVEYFEPIDSKQFANHGELSEATHAVVSKAYGPPQTQQ